jgi:hypothetical protein
LEIIREALRENWSLPEFEQRLRRNADVAHADVLLRFFKSHSVRMHESVAAAHVWNDTLGALAWRVDVKTKSRKGERDQHTNVTSQYLTTILCIRFVVQQDLSDPTAIVELAVKHGAMSGATKKDTSTVRFEMNKAQVADVVRQLAQIERVLSQQQ